MDSSKILFIDSERLSAFKHFPLHLACRSIAGTEDSIIFPLLKDVLDPVSKIVSVTLSKNKRTSLSANEVEKLESTYFISCIEGVNDYKVNDYDTAMHCFMPCFIYKAFKRIRESSDLGHYNNIFLFHFIILSLKMNGFHLSKLNLSSLEKYIREGTDRKLLTLLLSI